MAPIPVSVATRDGPENAVSRLCLLEPEWPSEKVLSVATAFEGQKFEQAPDRATYEDECRRGSSNYISSILQPYFNDSFPKSTVAHFCFSAIADFAESLINIQLASPNDMRSGEQLGDEALWQRISEGARAHSERLGT